MQFSQSTVFRVILVIVGGFIVYVGINVGFGGIPTLGWQVSPDFVTVTNAADYAVQDSHVRFLGGLFGATGLFLLLGATDIKRYQAELRLAFALIFVGGLTRFTALQPDVLFGAKVVMSLAAELLLMPILFFWLPRVLQTGDAPNHT